MKFTIDRSVFGKALDHVHGVIEQRHVQDLLSYIRICTADGGIELTGTDKEIFIQEKAAAEIVTAGEIILPAKLTHEIVRRLPDGVVIDISMADNGVQVSAGKSRFQLNVLDTAQNFHENSFPKPEDGPFSTEFSISAAALNHALKTVKMAISNDQMRHYLNGVYCHYGNDALCFVATDGHRLAYFAGECPKGAETMPGVIIPRKAITELMKLCEASDEEISVKVSDRLIRFDIGEVTLTSKLIGGEFPDYERVIPQDNDKKMQVDAPRLRKAVERVNIFSDDSCAVKLNVAKNHLKLVTRSQEYGEAADEMDVEYDNEALEIGYNAKYLMDIADNISGAAEFQWLNSSAATVVRDLANEQVLYVLMPMRV